MVKYVIIQKKYQSSNESRHSIFTLKKKIKKFNETINH